MAIQTGQTRLILASASPRRRELLASVGLAFEVRPANIDETPRPGESPAIYVERLAREKAVAVRVEGAIALAADTTVVIDGRILGKPENREDVMRMLSALSGKEHSVFTGVAVQAERASACVVETRVRFRPLSAAEIDWYSGTPEPMDKAGAYAIQGTAAVFVESIHGSHSNVIGLPLAETIALLQQAGLPMPWSAR